MLGQRWVSCIAVWAFASLALTWGAEGDSAAWTPADTALANQYIHALEQNPEYGRVLELLWKLYDDHGQTRLLLQYFEEASKPDNATAARILHGHLLRRKGNGDQALEQYRAVLASNPGSAIVHVHRAIAEILHDNDHADAAGSLASAEAWQGAAKPGTPDWIEAGLFRASRLRELGRQDDAVEVWQSLRAARPSDADLARKVVSLLLEEGRTSEAASIYEQLASTGDAEARLDALRELGRIREARDEPEAAIAAYEQALSALHFRHFQYDSFLTSLVRVRERFGGLDELTARWRQEAAGPDAPEDALWRMVRLSQLTAGAAEEEEWLRKLSSRAPSNTDYRQQLAAVCFRNDHVEEAGKIVEDLVKTASPVPADLVFLRAEIRLRQAGPGAAEKVLQAFLDQGGISPELLKRVLRFAETHYLDAIAERLLLDQKKSGWAEEGTVVDLKLAAFQHERGRDDLARETLRAYVEAAPGDAERGKRSAEAARKFADLRMPGDAQALLEGLVKAGRADRGHFLLLAELRDTQGAAGRAVEALEQAWTLSSTLEEREEVDERIFNLLRARAGEGESNGPDPEEGKVWKELWAYFDQVKRNAPDDAAPELRYRSAWWAVRIGDRNEAYRILPLLHDPEKPVLAYEELLLDLAERSDNQALVVRQLELIAEIDPRREEEALIRKAEMRLKLNFEDEAIRMLQSLVNRPGASLKAVQALARAYLQQGRYRALEELWSKAFAKANLLERREILEPYTGTLAKLGKIPDALELYNQMIPGESDLAQRRKLFDDQLALASRHYLLESWMRPRYELLLKTRPLDAFYPEALARVLQATGKHPEAFAAMKRAYYLSGGESSLLQPLSELASKAGDLAAAIYFQRKLLAGNAASAPEEWLGLIARLEETLDLAGGARVRRDLETKFGQDGDFLRQLARSAQAEGDLTSAFRIWGQVAALRPWDAASRFEYGLLQVDLGKTADAIASFESVLASTATARDGAEAFPLAPATKEVPVAGQSFGAPLQWLADAVAHFPFLEGPQREESVGWLLRTRTEFLRIPPDVHGLRLRAIEELGKLQGGTAPWAERWKGTSGPERLWAAIHGGAAPWAADAVQELADRPEIATFLGRFCYTVLSLRAGNDTRLLTWAGTDADRRYQVILGIDVLLRDPRFDFAPERLVRLIKASGLRLGDARRLMQNLYQDGKVRSCLQLGEAMAEVGPGSDYTFYQDVADVASELGDEAARERLIEQAFAGVDFQFRVFGRIPFQSVHRISTDLMALESPRWPRDKIVQTLSEKLKHAIELTELERSEASMWVSLAVGQTEKALKEMENLAGLGPGSPLPLADALPANALPGIPGEDAMANWDRIEDLLVLVGDRLPFREPLDRMAAELIERMRPPSGPGTEEANRHFAELRIRHLLWSLETANRPLRQRLIQEFLAMACGEDVHFELALGLEKQGMGAEALPVYAELLHKDSTSIEAARGFFNACRQTDSYDEALATIESYREGLLARPKAMTDDFLHRTRASFLYQAGRVEDLTRVAQEGQLGEGGPGALDSGERVVYQRALAAVYEERSDIEAASRVYEALRDSPDGLSKPDQIHLADCYIQLGRDSDAARILGDFKLRPGDPNADQVLRRLGAIHARRGPEGAGALRSLAVQAGRLGASVPACAELSAALLAAGSPELADALLDLRARRATERAARFEAGRQRISLRQGPAPGGGAEPLATDPELLVAWLRGWDGNVAEGEAVLALAQSATPEQRTAWAKASEVLAAEPASRLLADLIRLVQGAPAAEVCESINGYAEAESSGGLRLAAKVLTTHGQPGAARRWITEVHRRQEGNPLDDTGLILDICQAESDQGGMADWRDRLPRFPGPSSRFIDLAAEFIRVGQRDLALGLMADRYRSFRVLTEEQRYFLNTYAGHLIREGALEQARQVLLAMFQKTVGGDPSLLVDYYKAAGKLDQLEGELDKYYLSKPERERVLSLVPPGMKGQGRPVPQTSAIR